MPPVSWPTASIFCTWPRWASAGSRGAGGHGELVPAPRVKPFELADPHLLLGAAALERLQLPDLVSGELPVAGIDVAAGLDVLVEHEAGERSLRARHVGADIAHHQ